MRRRDLTRAVSILFLLVVGLVPFPSQVAEGGWGPSWKSIETNYFVINFPAPLEEAAVRMSAFVDPIHEEMSRKFLWRPKGRTEIVLLDNQDEANGFSYLLPYNWILLYVVAPRPDEPLGTHDDWLKTIFIHEYTHVLHIDQYGGAITPFRWILGKLVAPNGLSPTWYREGLATLEETLRTTQGRGRSSYTDMILRTMILDKSFMPQSRANGYGWKWPGSSVPYFYGVEFLEYLAKTRGEQSLVAYNRNVSSSLVFFASNHHAKKAFGKNLESLWNEWRRSLEAQVEVFRARCERQGLTTLETILSGPDAYNAYAESPDGSRIVYLSESPTRAPQIRYRNATEDTMIVGRVNGVQRIAFSPDGRRIVFSLIRLYRRKFYLKQLAVYDFDKKKEKILSKGVRGEDPVFTPDGKAILFIRDEAGTKQLVTLGLETEELKSFGDPAPAFSQFSHPAFSPNGQRVVVTAWHENRWDLKLYDASGRALSWLTDDGAMDLHPSWKDDDTVLFSSDRDGAFNIYQISLRNRRVARLTNVLTGVFEPTVTADGRLMVHYFRSGGFDIRRVQGRGEGRTPLLSGARETSLPERSSSSKRVEARESPAASLGTAPKAGDVREEESSALPSPPAAVREENRSLPGLSRPYSALKPNLFIPRYLIPTAVNLDKGFLFNGQIGSQDPAQWHMWQGGANYRTDVNFLGGFFQYAYARFPPHLLLGAQRYAFDLAQIQFRDATGAVSRSLSYIEQRTRGALDLAIPFAPHEFFGGYFYEDRREHSSLSDQELTGLKSVGYNTGGYAGLEFGYFFNNARQYPASISWETGRRVRLIGFWTDQSFGSALLNEQRIFSGDWREYFDLPWGRHVWGVRAAGGIAYGDEGLKRTFTLGGALGEIPGGAGASPFYFPLRGLPLAGAAGTRVMLLSTEYRLPLFSPQTTFPIEAIFVRELHFATFADFGNTWVKDTSMPVEHFFDNFLLSVGGELRGDFVINPGIPFYGRLGYGVVVWNRNRIAGLEEPILKTPLTSGTLILQMGSSF